MYLQPNCRNDDLETAPTVFEQTLIQSLNVVSLGSLKSPAGNIVSTNTWLQPLAKIILSKFIPHSQTVLIRLCNFCRCDPVDYFITLTIKTGMRTQVLRTTIKCHYFPDTKDILFIQRPVKIVGKCAANVFFIMELNQRMSFIISASSHPSHSHYKEKIIIHSLSSQLFQSKIWILMI